MKTQIVNIEPHDDYGSLRDKLLWTKSARVIFIWPGRAETLSSRLDLMLLKRLGQQRGITLGLMTFDPQVRAHAQDLSIPVIEDLENIAESTWDIWQPGEDIHDSEGRLPDLIPPNPMTGIFYTPQNPILRLLILLLPVATFLYALLLLVPSARITLQPPGLRETETLYFSLTSSEDYLQIPYELRQREVAGDYRLPTSGTRSAPDQFAQGEVIFTNLSNQAITIPEGTTVRGSSTPSIFFRTLRTVQLDAGEGEQVTAQVAASEPGPEGNLREGAIDSIDGALGLDLLVTNPDPFSGGTTQIRAAVSTTDLRQIKQLLEFDLKQAFLSELAETLLPDERMLVTTLQIVETINADYDADAGDIADTLSLNLSQVAEIAVINEARLEQIAADNLRGDLPPGYSLSPGSPSVISIEEESESDSGLIVIRVELSVSSFRDIDKRSISEAARGLTVGDLEAYLSETFSFELAPIISISPSWWPRLPFFAHQIEVMLSPQGVP